MSDTPLVTVEDLEVKFVSREATVHAVNGISFSLAKGEVLGILGESGSGKSVTLRALMRLLPRAKARLAGYSTLLLEDLPFQHHRTEGERDALSTSAWLNEGRGSHFLGYRPSYLLLRALGKMRRDPRAGWMIAGYFAQVLRRAPRYADQQVVDLIRDEQRWRHLGARAREALGRRRKARQDADPR